MLPYCKKQIQVDISKAFLKNENKITLKVIVGSVLAVGFILFENKELVLGSDFFFFFLNAKPVMLIMKY